MKNLKYFYLLLLTGCLQLVNAQDIPAELSASPHDELTMYLIYTLALCPGSCDGQVTTVVDGGQPPYYYSWSNGATTPEIHDLCPGAGEVTVTDNSGSTASAMYDIEVQPVPYVFFENLIITQPSGGQNNGSIAIDSTIQIDTTLFNPDSLWSLDSIHFTPFYIFPHLGPGVYHLYIIAPFSNCIVRAGNEIILYDITAVENLNTTFSLFPNPVSNDLRLYGDLPLSVAIMDMNGKLIFKENSLREHVIQMASFPEGMYMLKISDGEKIAFRKIVKTGASG